MRFLLVIATLLLFIEYSNLVHLLKWNTADQLIFYCDPETEEENKTEKEFKQFKSDKHHYYYAFDALLSSLTKEGACLYNMGFCQKGHSPLIDQPPEA
jgi:hypothetical protein